MRRFLPSLPARDPEERHRAATQLELLFDLVSVIAIAAVTAGLHHAISEGHGLEKLPAFVFLFTAIWWAWMNFTWFASAFDSDGPGYRLLVMVIMLGALIFAGGAEHIFETGQFSWGVVGWTIMRLGMAALWLRASANVEYRATAYRYAIGIVIAQALWIWFSFAVPPGSLAFFVLGALVFLFEFAVPVFAERARMTPFHRHHIIERYGLLTIISLGEILLAVSLGFGALYGSQPNGQVAITATSAFIMAFAIFWLYFCEREHLPEKSSPPRWFGAMRTSSSSAGSRCSVRASVRNLISSRIIVTPAAKPWPGGSVHPWPSFSSPSGSHATDTLR